MSPTVTWLLWNAILSVLVFKVPRKAIFRGKILTMPLRRRFKLFRLEPGTQHDFRGFLFRNVQVAASFVVYAFPIADAVADTISWLVCIGFFVDDWLTGDDENWKRYKDAVRNKVRWLMELPAASEPDVA